MRALKIIAGAALLLFCASFMQVKGGRELPPITHTGENMMACRVNGKVVVASESGDDLGSGSSVRFNESETNELGYITCTFISPRYDIELSFDYDDTLGTYPIIDHYPRFGYFWDYTRSLSPNDSNQFQPDDTHTGSVTVLYKDNKVIAGTFAFDAINRKGKVVHITDGRFDIAIN